MALLVPRIGLIPRIAPEISENRRNDKHGGRTLRANRYTNTVGTHIQAGSPWMLPSMISMLFIIPDDERHSRYSVARTSATKNTKERTLQTHSLGDVREGRGGGRVCLLFITIERRMYLNHTRQLYTLGQSSVVIFFTFDIYSYAKFDRHG